MAIDGTFHVLNRMVSNGVGRGVLIEGWPVQFLPVASDLDVDGLDQAIEVEIESIKVRVLRPEHLVANALTVGRPKDYLRILAFLSSEHLGRSALAKVLERYDLWGAWVDYCRKSGLTDPTWVELRS